MNPREALAEARRTVGLVGVLADVLEASLNENEWRDDLGSVHYAALRAEKERADKAEEDAELLWNVHARAEWAEGEIARLNAVVAEAGELARFYAEEQDADDPCNFGMMIAGGKFQGIFAKAVRA